jgi:hypothetical protein
VKYAICDIVGKCIAHVIVKRGPNAPRSQVMLVFTDGSWYELYCGEEEIRGSGMLGEGGLAAARAYMPDRRIVLEA